MDFWRSAQLSRPRTLKSTQGLRKPGGLSGQHQSKVKNIQSTNFTISAFPKKWQDGVWNLRTAGGDADGGK